MNNLNAEEFKERALSIRRRMVSVADHCNNSIHWASSFSCVEILLYLMGYKANTYLNGNLPDEDRDIIINSKGHTSVALYSVLAEIGIVPENFVESFQGDGSIYTEELEVNDELKLLCSTGSLGIGLPYAVGKALRDKIDQRERKIYCLMGDGECNEGSVWEAVGFARQHGLSDLTVIVDRNHMQLDGMTKDIMEFYDLEGIFRSFGWHVETADGYDCISLDKAFASETEKGVPKAIIVETVKGRGISFMENNPEWHDRLLDRDNLIQAKKELNMEV